ncbi:cupredoxin domain-containing protein [Rossellomorea aquimaris]|uniref:cupredoxin domain-containing protein n=1 Tax=Rossellomorea aquimaris TaxID=189382 RepID=UPI001CD53361|nr:cupredoxin domain-containing protein [Rossellomorea aquimaris]MCA1058579.1 cupredoxin domain-containing protein [Rossellomorea aquimaris]
MNFIVLKKGSILAILVTLLIITVGTIWSLSSKNSYPTVSLSEKTGEKQVIQLVTGEFKSQTAEGKEIEAYRWDPGTIVVEKGREVELRIYGVNGMEHPFYIEGTDITGTVRKGKETVVNVTFPKEGTYRLICETHETIQNNGPMIAYIVVD